MAEVVLKNVSKYYDSKVKAVKNVDLHINNGEFAVLVGPSGCGKTTTLRMIAGLEEVSEGDISIGGKVVNDVAPKDRDIAMVFQNYALYPHMNVYENMAYGLKLRKFPKTEIDRRIQEAAAKIGLQELLERKPAQLSGGQRQRVALGRAIVRDPQVFLMDEPLSNLDAKLRVQTRIEIKKLQKSLDTTMIYVTHDQVEAMTMGDKIVVMKDGIVQQAGSPDELYHRPVNQFVAGFIGSPAMNFIRGMIVDEGHTMRFFAPPGLDLALLPQQAEILRTRGYAQQEILLGIRPENLKLLECQTYANVLHADIDVVENMGSEHFLYFSNIANSQIVAKLQAQHCPRAKEHISIGIEIEKAHFFDLATEVAII